MPITATPAATDIPMIEPVDSPPPPSSSLDVFVLVGAAVLDKVSDDEVTVTVTGSPAGLRDVLTAGGGVVIVRPVVVEVVLVADSAVVPVLKVGS
jgi:hypothetical protein